MKTITIRGIVLEGEIYLGKDGQTFLAKAWRDGALVAEVAGSRHPQDRMSLEEKAWRRLRDSVYEIVLGREQARLGGRRAKWRSS